MNTLHLIAMWNRALSGKEIKKLSRNPWRLFKRKRLVMRPHGNSMRKRRRNFVWRMKT